MKTLSLLLAVALAMVGSGCESDGRKQALDKPVDPLEVWVTLYVTKPLAPHLTQSLVELARPTVVARCPGLGVLKHVTVIRGDDLLAKPMELPFVSIGDVLTAAGKAQSAMKARGEELLKYHQTLLLAKDVPSALTAPALDVHPIRWSDRLKSDPRLKGWKVLIDNGEGGREEPWNDIEVVPHADLAVRLDEEVCKRVQASIIDGGMATVTSDAPRLELVIVLPRPEDVNAPRPRELSPQPTTSASTSSVPPMAPAPSQSTAAVPAPSLTTATRFDLQVVIGAAFRDRYPEKIAVALSPTSSADCPGRVFVPTPSVFYGTKEIDLDPCDGSPDTILTTCRATRIMETPPVSLQQPIPALGERGWSQVLATVKSEEAVVFGGNSVAALWARAHPGTRAEVIVEPVDAEIAARICRQFKLKTDAVPRLSILYQIDSALTAPASTGKLAGTSAATTAASQVPIDPGTQQAWRKGVVAGALGNKTR